MSNLQLSIIGGIFFGMWPLLMNRSGLGGNVSALAFASIVTIIVLPFAIPQFHAVQNVKWMWVIGAGITASVGVLSFNGMLAKATPQEVSTLFLVCLIMQMTVPAINHMIQSGSFNPQKFFGILLAGCAAYLLNK